MWNIALREKFNGYFSEVFASINKIIFTGILGTRLSFYEVWIMSLFFPNFIRSQVLRRSATREATRIYHVYK